MQWLMGHVITIVDRNSKRGIFYLTRIIVLHAYWTDGVYAVNTNALHASAQLNMEKNIYKLM